MKTQESTRVINELELYYSLQQRVFDEPELTSSYKAHDYVKQAYDPNSISFKESFVAIALNKANKPLGIIRMSNGGIDSTVVDVRILMAALLKSLATAVILCHNHPSGALRPSDADIRLTSKIKTACEFFDIKLLDHLILSPTDNYFSFADEGIL